MREWLASGLPWLLVGMATGGWWSRRRAIARAVAAARAEATAAAQATSGHVVVVGSPEDALRFIGDGRADYHAATAVHDGRGGSARRADGLHPDFRWPHPGLRGGRSALPAADLGSGLDPGWSDDELRALGLIAPDVEGRDL